LRLIISFCSHIASSFWTCGFLLLCGIATVAFMRWLPWSMGCRVPGRRMAARAARSRRAPELDRVGEGPGLFPDRRHLAGVLGVLEGRVRDLVPGQHVLQHRA